MGDTVGLVLGADEGMDGLTEGDSLGDADGLCDGTNVGLVDGAGVGLYVGIHAAAAEVKPVPGLGELSVGQAVFVVAVVMVPAGGLIWMSPVYGFFLGGVGVLAPLIIQEFFGLKHFGAVSGLSSMATVASFGIGPIIAGLSFDMTGSYASSFLIAAAFFLFAALLLMFTRSASSLSFEDTAQDGASR